MGAFSRLKSAVKASAASRYLCGRDDFVRHRAAARLLGPGIRTALDVGGEGLMSNFRRDVRFTTVNVKRADAVASAERLPFRDESFDAVASIDTLEHLPRGIRKAAVAEMARVARKRVVLAAPLGTREHADFERRLLEDLERSGSGDTEYLAEHVRNGLPTPEDLAELMRTFGGKAWFQGDFRKAGCTTTGNRHIQFVHGILDNIADDLLYVKRTFDHYGKYTNRFFLAIDLVPKDPNR